jgi:hypothetical protein
MPSEIPCPRGCGHPARAPAPQPRAVCEASRRCCCGFSRRCEPRPTRRWLGVHKTSLAQFARLPVVVAAASAAFPDRCRPAPRPALAPIQPRAVCEASRRRCCGFSRRCDPGESVPGRVWRWGAKPGCARRRARYRRAQRRRACYGQTAALRSPGPPGAHPSRRPGKHLWDFLVFRPADAPPVIDCYTFAYLPRFRAWKGFVHVDQPEWAH